MVQSETINISTLKLMAIRIENYRAINKVELSFLRPAIAVDTFATMLGSRNGLGKTSVLESCALLFLALSDKSESMNWQSFLDFKKSAGLSLDPFDLIVRHGAERAIISGDFVLGDKEFSIELTLGKEEFYCRFSNRPHNLNEFIKRLENPMIAKIDSFRSIIGISGEPMIAPPFFYFNSYRKVQEASPEIGMLVRHERYWRQDSIKPRSSPFSTFKTELLRSMMIKGGLFEQIGDYGPSQAMDILNSLTQEYANGKIAKLRLAEDNTIGFRISPTSGGLSYSFDGLSSGQKEIISTLFLIWRYTNKNPGIVLIDEPELHINPEWHKGFIRRLGELQPLNQYIIATHSEHFFESVSEENRLLLKSTVSK
jgi:predicted ATP-dependent endonuclease of OLD family